MDRTVATGTGYVAQYAPPVEPLYESLKATPDKVLLFFHHVPYTYVLHLGKTVIQQITIHITKVPSKRNVSWTIGSLSREGSMMRDIPQPRHGLNIKRDKPSCGVMTSATGLQPLGNRRR